MSMTIAEALQELDLPSPDDVAEKLRAAGITGSVNARKCPIARYVKRATGKHALFAAFDAIHHDRMERTRTYPYPRAVAQFVARFDKWNYPDLLETS